MKNNDEHTLPVSFNQEADCYEMTLNGKTFTSESEDSFEITLDELSGIHSSELPENITVNIEDSPEKSNGLSLVIDKTGTDNARITISCSDHCRFYTGDIGIESYFAVKVIMIQSRAELNAKIETYYLDDKWLHLEYSIEVPSGDLKELALQAINIDEEINSQLDKAIPNTVELCKAKLQLPDIIIGYTEY